MRLWTIHPKYLDSKGLVAAWREGLLAKKVLEGETRGYVNHPQLTRFKESDDPIRAIVFYLNQLYRESQQRGYRFNRSKLGDKVESPQQIAVTEGQVAYEFALLKNKLAVRNPQKRGDLESVDTIDLNPLFTPVKGPIETWERVKELNR